jgi:hypothetical protein
VDRIRQDRGGQESQINGRSRKLILFCDALIQKGTNIKRKIINCILVARIWIPTRLLASGMDDPTCKGILSATNNTLSFLFI